MLRARQSQRLHPENRGELRGLFRRRLRYAVINRE